MTKPKSNLISIKKMLEDEYGGKWRHNNRAHRWECRDGRYVCWVANCMCDDICGCGSTMYLYESGKTPIRIGLSRVNECER